MIPPQANGTATAAAAALSVPSAPSKTTSSSTLDQLYLADPPPLDSVWLQHERDLNLPNPRPVLPAIERQPVYVIECRELLARMTAPGARDHHLAGGVRVTPLTVPSSLDSYAIPVLAYSLEGESQRTNGQPDGQNGHKECNGCNGKTPDPDYVVLYIHGGGLHIGEADSEELSCRRILKTAELPPVPGSSLSSASPTLIVYSVGYRLMPQNPASTCVADCIDAFCHVRAAHPRSRLLLVGSSSGGELAAFVAQDAALHPEHGPVHGVVLRCPVTSDAFNGEAYVPAALRALHNSAGDLRFRTTLLGRMNRLRPRDGLPYMPLEAPAAVLAAQPRHWIQVCTNDMLYSDGVCYAKAIVDAAAPAEASKVQVDVVVGWPHTFWLKTPWMDRALEADNAMLRGLAWVAGGP